MVLARNRTKGHYPHRAQFHADGAGYLLSPTTEGGGADRDGGDERARREAGPVPERGLRQGARTGNRTAGPHRDDGYGPVQKTAPAAPQRDQIPRETGGAADQAARGRWPDAADGHRQIDRGREGPASRGSRRWRVGEDAEERQDRVLQRARGDRHLPGDRDAGGEGQRHGDGEAGARDPPRGGADGDLLAGPDQAIGGCGRARRHSGTAAERRQAAAPSETESRNEKSGCAQIPEPEKSSEPDEETGAGKSDGEKTLGPDRHLSGRLGSFGGDP